MSNLLVDRRDVDFILYEMLNIEELCSAPHLEDYSRDVFDMVITQAEKMAINELYPTNQDGDRTGCHLEDGQVVLPASFKPACRSLAEGGWFAVVDPVEEGGQGLPWSVYAPVYEYFGAANYVIAQGPILTHGAAKILEIYGTSEQKEKYMTRMYAGEWGGTMCLTEAGAGSDVGALTTRAMPRDDGKYNIEGNKLFISYGDHDLADNIIHMVLARVPGAPEGTRGISLFVVPKFCINADGSIGESNHVVTGRVETKMGLHASPTCLLHFGEDGECIGELVGQEGQGLTAMFHMMNEARLATALQGVSLSSAAYLHALGYASERIQGQAVFGPEAAGGDRVPIIRHPDVVRTLLEMKANVEGMRALTYFAYYCLDRRNAAADPVEKAHYAGMVELLTPIAKAYCTDKGFDVCVSAVQVHGGYGYCSEYPVEQFLRDCKISSIWEGTNGIQAIDLIKRKIQVKGGAFYANYMEIISKFIEENKQDESLGKYIRNLESAKCALNSATDFLRERSAGSDALTGYFNATPYIELFGDFLIGWMLLWQAVIARQKMNELVAGKGLDPQGNTAEVFGDNRQWQFYQGKLDVAKWFASHLLVLAPAKADAILNGDVQERLTWLAEIA